MVTVSLFPDQVEILNSLSEVTGDTKSSITRRALEDFDKKYRKESARRAKEIEDAS